MQIEESSGNVFKDLNLKHYLTLQLRSELTVFLMRELKSRDKDLKVLSKELGVTHYILNRVSNGWVEGLTLEKLFHVASKLGYTIKVKLEQSEEEQISIPLKIKQK